jgi:hypothetical protein
MSDKPFRPNDPQLKSVGDDKWEVDWDRTPESEAIRALQSSLGGKNPVLQVRNVDRSNETKLLEYIRKIPDRKVIEWNGVLLPTDVWQLFIKCHFDRTALIPRNLGAAFIKYARYAWAANRLVEGPTREIGKASLSMFSNNSKTTLSQVLASISVKFAADDSSEDVAISAIPGGEGDALMQFAFKQDYAHDAEFRNFIDGALFSVRGGIANLEAILSPLDVSQLRMILLSQTRLFEPGIGNTANGGRTISVGVVGVAEATDLIEPIWHDERASQRSKAFVQLILKERARTLSADPTRYLCLGEAALSDIVGTIRQALAESIQLDSVLPRRSPIDADVVDDRLILRDGVAISGGTPLDALEEFRIRYFEDAERISGALVGTNASEGFFARLRSVTRTLAKAFTRTSVLVLGDQARALEVMLPAVSEMLTDATAADLGAFISGLGLLTRQFPEWRTFVEEARDTRPLAREDLDALGQIARVIKDAPDNIVDQRLREALADAAEAADGLEDRVVELSLVRSVGNVVRAIARFILDRAKGIGREFNQSVEKKIGEALAGYAVGGLLLSVAVPLLHLAAGMTLEFGWVVGLGILMAIAK